MSFATAILARIHLTLGLSQWEGIVVSKSYGEQRGITLFKSDSFKCYTFALLLDESRGSLTGALQRGLEVIVFVIVADVFLIVRMFFLSVAI